MAVNAYISYTNVYDCREMIFFACIEQLIELTIVRKLLSIHITLIIHIRIKIHSRDKHKQIVRGVHNGNGKKKLKQTRSFGTS